MSETDRTRDPQDRSNLISGAVVLVLLLVGAGLAVWALTGGFGRGGGAAYSVYFPGVTQLPSGTEVLYKGVHVGELRETDPPRAGLQLQLAAGVVPEVAEIITLFPGDSLRVVAPRTGAPVTLGLESLTVLTMRWDSGAVRLSRGTAGVWAVESSGARLVVNGRALGAGPDAAVRTGDVLVVDGLQIEWRDVEELSRLRVEIALDKLRKAAGAPDTVPAERLLGPRSALGMVNAFGLGTPALRLEPGYGRTAFVTGADRVIAPAPTLDLERTVQGMLTYLNSPAALRREPATRFERVVSDLNRSLDQVAALGEQLESFTQRLNAVSAESGGRGMVGRLVFAPATLDSLNATASRLAAITAPLADTGRSLLARLRMDSLDAGMVRTVASADRALRAIDSAVGKAGEFIDTLTPSFRSVRDSVTPLIGRGSGLVSQGTATARGINRWLPPFLVTGSALALTGILKLIGVF